MGETQKTVAGFSIRWTGHLGADGKPLGEMPAAAADREFLTSLYRMMVLTRLFDEKAVALQRTGSLGTYASALGEEAIGVGVASAMRATDVLAPTFRDQGAQLWRGVTPLELLLYWGGDERGSDYAVPREDFPTAIPVATQFPHAVGAAVAFSVRGQDRVAVAIGGDGSTSRGDFYESMNIAGVWRLPVVFVISNNQWAISVPRSAQTATQTLAQKAIGAGISGEQVDGNDVIAVNDVLRRAIETARTGGGPALVEAVTYRITDHTTADDARRYRSDAEVSESFRREPIARLRTFLVEAHGWTKADEERLWGGCRQEIATAIEDYRATPAPAVASIFDHHYRVLPAALKRQRDALLARSGEAQ